LPHYLTFDGHLPHHLAKKQMTDPIKNILMVFLGGGAGSCCRYLLSKWLNPLFAFMPLGTLASNALSCLVMGFFAVWFLDRIGGSEIMKMLVLVGFCGGFSTFSTFSNELITLSRGGDWLRPFLYLVVSLAIGISFIALGALLGGKVVKG